MPSVSAAGRTGDISRQQGSTAADHAERRRALLLTAAFLCVAAIGTAGHEIWRDEWQAWMIARDSASLAQLLRNMTYEGHPPGWYLILFGLSRLTRAAAAMQAFHVAVAATSVYLLARYSPLPWIQKVLIAFGYFFVYEYAVIARAYALTVLALFALCALFPHRHRNPVPLIVSLAALALVSVYSMIIGIAAAGMLLLERATDPQRDRWWFRRARYGAGAIVLAAATAAAILIMRPSNGPPLRFFERGQPLTTWAVAETASSVAEAYLPVPDLSAPHPWNTHALSSNERAGLGTKLALSIAVITGAGLLLARRPPVLFMYGTGMFGILLFQHLYFAGTVRHHGHMFVLFIACLWLAHLPGREWRLPRRLRHFAIDTTPGRAFLVGLLIVHCGVAALLYAAELRRPFSASPQVAQLIHDRGLHDLPIAVSPAPAGSSIAGLLDRPVYYVAMQSTGTFVRWREFVRRWDLQLTMELLRPFIDDADSDVLIILAAPFDAWDDDLAVTELARFEPGLEHREGYVVYRVSR